MTGSNPSLAAIVEELKQFYEPQPDAPRDAFAFYLWYVLGQRILPVRRDAAIGALRRIPAMTPDSFWKAPRAKLHAALAHAGPPEERLHTIMAGVEVFRRHRDLEDRLCGPIVQARRATRLLVALGPVGAQWMLLAVGNHPVLPRHAGIGRFATRLGLVQQPASASPLAYSRAARAVAAVVPHDVALLKTAMIYLSHHASVTCTVADPHCRVCPLAAGCAGTGRMQNVEG